MNSVYLNQFHIVKPKHCVQQDVLIHWIIKCHQLAESFKDDSSIDPILLEKLFLRYGVKPSQISQRFFESDDMLAEKFDQNHIYKIDEVTPNGIQITERAHFFSQRAYEIFNQFYDLDHSSHRPNHLIHVTCTGYISPSAAQKIVGEEQWNQVTDVTHAYHMGCYASLPAIRLARSLVLSESSSNPHFKADIVHNEMCGLHMNAQVHTPEQMVVQTLFADGHAKYSITSSPKKDHLNLKILAILEKIIPQSVSDMSWVPASWGMQMNLSREVPAKIKPELKSFIELLFGKIGRSFFDYPRCIFAVHPGGPKIIDTVQAVLELGDEQLRESRKILFERGNMSSATLPHVWNEILNNDYPAGTIVVSLAFGPGLTLFGALFEVC